MSHLPPAGGIIVDIGTAGGAFLRLLEEHGWVSIGLDRTREAVVGSLRFVQASFPFDSPFRTGSVDALCAWAVFEHLYDPDRAFAETSRMLRSGGTLTIQVPSIRSLGNRFGMQEDVPRHVYFFSPRSLRRYGRKHGLEIERISHTTDLFGGSGRGTLRLSAFRIIRQTPERYLEFQRLTLRERFQDAKALAFVWYATAAVERIFLADAVVKRLRFSGQIVVTFRKQ